MLSNEDRVSPHWCLFPIVFRKGRPELCRNEIFGMRPDHIHALLVDILQVLLALRQVLSPAVIADQDQGVLRSDQLIAVFPEKAPDLMRFHVRCFFFCWNDARNLVLFQLFCILRYGNGVKSM